MRAREGNVPGGIRRAPLCAVNAFTGWILRTPGLRRLADRQGHRAARSGVGQVVKTSAAGRAEAADIFAARFPDIPVQDDPIVVITIDPVPDRAPR